MLLFLALAFTVSQSTSLVSPSTSINDVAWLAGCWEFTRGARHVTEQWTRPDGGTMLGLSRTISNGKTTEYEFVLLREAGGRLEYVARPSRQAEAVFTSVRVSADEAIFENPQHDFPTRIHYRRQADGRLLATIEGTVNGNRRTIEFPYQPAACGR